MASGFGMSGLSRLTGGQSRAISPENPTGAKGSAAMASEGVASAAARGLGRGWKVAPYVVVPAGSAGAGLGSLVTGPTRWPPGRVKAPVRSRPNWLGPVCSPPPCWARC